MTKEQALNRYEQLEASVILELAVKINNSEYISKHTGKKALEVNIFGNTELILRDGHLIFVDKKGYEYSLFSDATLIDLIELL